MYRAGAKRVVDVLLTSLVLLVVWPVLLIVSWAIRIKLGAPVLFRQQRPGLHGRPFTILKFRTMTHAKDSNGTLLPDGDRLPGVGRLLRSTSIDELPELWNVLRGDMSLVGPRPLLTRYLNRYSPEQARRQDVRPGITGLAQVNGRNALTWEDKFRLDLWYVDHMSARLDLWILAQTIARVIKREGISSDTHATMDEFMGTGGGKPSDAP